MTRTDDWSERKSSAVTRIRERDPHALQDFDAFLHAPIVCLANAEAHDYPEFFELLANHQRRTELAARLSSVDAMWLRNARNMPRMFSACMRTLDECGVPPLHLLIAAAVDEFTAPGTDLIRMDVLATISEGIFAHLSSSDRPLVEIGAYEGLFGYRVFMNAVAGRDPVLLRRMETARAEALARATVRHCAVDAGMAMP